MRKKISNAFSCEEIYYLYTFSLFGLFYPNPKKTARIWSCSKCQLYAIHGKILVVASFFSQRRKPKIALGI